MPGLLERLATLEATLTRLGLAARTQAADARAVDSWWDGRAFDAILLDAPCSGTGVIRRHPDIKWLRRPADIAAAVSFAVSGDGGWITGETLQVGGGLRL